MQKVVGSSPIIRFFTKAPLSGVSCGRREADRLIASHIVTLPLYSRPGFPIHKSQLKGVLINPRTPPDLGTESWPFAD